MTDRFPTMGTHRGVPIFAFQDNERIEDVVKPEIDKIHAMNDTKELYEFAIDFWHCPEARLFAKAKIVALFETRASAHEARGDIDMAKLTAATVGLDKISTFGQYADYYHNNPMGLAPGIWQTLPRRPQHVVVAFMAAREKADDWRRSHRRPSVQVEA